MQINGATAVGQISEEIMYFLISACPLVCYIKSAGDNRCRDNGFDAPDYCGSAPKS